MAIDLTGPVTRVQRFYVLTGCALGISAIAMLDRYSGRAVPSGGFYLLPLAVAAAFVSRWSIFILAIATAFVSEYFGPAAWGPETPQRLTLSIVAFTGVGLFAGELARNRRMAVELLRKTQQEARLRLDTVTEIRALLESSPVGV